MATHILSRRILAAATIAISLTGCGMSVREASVAAQADIARQKAAGTWPVHFRSDCEAPNACTPAQRASWEVAMRKDDALAGLANDVYADEVGTYGRQAVLECRSRMLSTNAYIYCLEANKRPDRSRVKAQAKN